ncbi:VOC family protein [Chelatococcus sp. GCM10030263]|uniref:VOC family protein n=1 Tax=Chelatococcus sp. GCM10030263 TaxID=3273387 RepID=UPI003610A98B
MKLASSCRSAAHFMVDRPEASRLRFGLLCGGRRGRDSCGFSGRPHRHYAKANIAVTTFEGGEEMSSSTPEASDEVRRPVLHHVTFRTGRLQEMIDWYGNLVGVRPLFQFEGGAWLTNDAANHRIAFLFAPEIADDPDLRIHSGMHHSAFEYVHLDDLLLTWERLDKQGIKPHFAVDHGLTTSIYYVDPDGNSVELQADNFGDWAASSEFMRSSPYFAKNPIGQPVDPCKMLEARRAGMDAKEVQRRAYAGEFPPEEEYDVRFGKAA